MGLRGEGVGSFKDPPASILTHSIVFPVVSGLFPGAGAAVGGCPWSSNGTAEEQDGEGCVVLWGAPACPRPVPAL